MGKTIDVKLVRDKVAVQEDRVVGLLDKLGIEIAGSFY